MLRRWSFTFVGVVVLAAGIWRLLSPPATKITLLPVAQESPFSPWPPKTGRFQEPPRLVLAIYDVTDILDAARQHGLDRKRSEIDLRFTITANVARSSWPSLNESQRDIRSIDRARYATIGNRLLIVQTEDAHRQIIDLLQAIRRANGLKWAWKAK